MMLTWDTITPFAVFLAITLGAWFVMTLVADRPVTAEDRLKRVLDPAARRVDPNALGRKQDRLQEKVAKVANKLGESFRPSNEAQLGAVRLELLNAGFRDDQAVAVYYGLKLFALLLCLAVAAPIVVGKYGLNRGSIPYIV